MDASCCPFPSAQRLESLFGEVFWGFISSPCILISYLLTEIVSSSRNQLSQPALAYATASLLPPCPRSHFFLSSDFREQTMAACAAGIPFVSWAETTRDFRSRTGLFRPHQEVLGVPSLAIFPDISGHGFSAIWPWEIRDFTWAPAWEMEMARRRPKR